MTLANFGDNLLNFGKGFRKAFDEATLLAANEIKSNIETRVFSDAKGINGQPIGKYKSQQYKKKRQKEGLQIGTVDLIFNGDLLRSIDLGISNGDNVVRFGDKKNTIKGRANEERFRGSENTIFAASKDEREIAIDVINEHIGKFIKQTFKQ